MEARDWPACKKCAQGVLIPLSDYGRDGAPITYKAWVCSNPECGIQSPDRQRRDLHRKDDRAELQNDRGTANSERRTGLHATPVPLFTVPRSPFSRCP